MADKAHLFKRGNTWFVRVTVPRHLQDVLDKKLIRRSLKTTSLTEANRHKHAVIAEIRKLLADAEQATGRASNTTTPPTNYLQTCGPCGASGG